MYDKGGMGFENEVGIDIWVVNFSEYYISRKIIIIIRWIFIIFLWRYLQQLGHTFQLILTVAFEEGKQYIGAYISI